MAKPRPAAEPVKKNPHFRIGDLAAPDNPIRMETTYHKLLLQTEHSASFPKAANPARQSSWHRILQTLSATDPAFYRQQPPCVEPASLRPKHCARWPKPGQGSSKRPHLSIPRKQFNAFSKPKSSAPSYPEAKKSLLRALSPSCAFASNAHKPLGNPSSLVASRMGEMTCWHRAEPFQDRSIMITPRGLLLDNELKNYDNFHIESHHQRRTIAG